MNQILNFYPGISVMVLALHQLRRLLRRLDVMLQRLARHRKRAVAASRATPQAPLGLWAGSLNAARVHRHGQRD